MRRGLAVTAGAAVLALFAACAAVFGAHQAIWIDETTQLSGLALPFGTQLAWLTGRVDPGLGVPADRMPPLSYWLGGLWAGAFGLSETALRLFGIVSMLAAAPAIWLAARRIGGVAGALCALGVVYLSSGLVVQAVEIRAYPLFFAFSAWAVLAFVLVLQDTGGRRRGPLAALTVTLLLASYTHFFGVVLAGLLWLTLLAVVVAQRRPLGPALAAALVYGVATAGLLPFILSALQMSGGGAPSAAAALPLKAVLADTARLAVRLVVGSPSFVHPALIGTSLLAVGGLVVLALATLRQPALDTPPRVWPWLLVPVALAFVLLPLLKLRIASFDVLAPHYNLWLVPLVALVLSAALSAPSRAMRGAAAALTGLLFVSSLGAMAVLLRHPQVFTHGPGEWVAGEVSVPERTLVVHDATGLWGAAYFPLHYLTGGRVTQVLQAADGGRQLIGPRGLTDAPTWPADRFDRIVYVKAGAMSTSELAQVIRGPQGCQPPAPRTAAAPFAAQDRARVYCAFTSAAIVVQTRGDGPP